MHPNTDLSNNLADTFRGGAEQGGRTTVAVFNGIGARGYNPVFNNAI